MNTTDHEEIQSRDANRRGELHHGGFAAGTLVHTKEGLKPIETLQVGDLVLSFPDNQRTPDRIRDPDEFSYRQITQVFSIEEQQLSKVTVANLASGSMETVSATPSQSIWCKGRDWIAVIEMDIAGDTVENFRFGNLRVYRCFHNIEVGTAYNFKVDEHHTYYVGEEGVWVLGMTK